MAASSSNSSSSFTDDDELDFPSPNRKEYFSSRPTPFANKMLSKISNLLIKNGRQEKVYFCVEKELPVSSMDITIKKIGKLQFPLAKELINKLISNSTKIKFENCDHDFPSKMKCSTNEIKAGKLNAKINKDLFKKMLSEVGQELGLPETTSLEPHLYNILVYGPGQSRKKHQDAEKAGNIIATLVIVLPVEHVGGDLIIKHNKEKHVFYSDDIDTNNFKCVVYYEDCTHKVKEVTRGYLIVLTYNLIALSKDMHYSNLELEKLIKMYFNNEGSIHDLHLIYFFDHSYTEHNLRWNMLKGTDIKNGSAMYNAAKILNLVPHLVLVEISIKSNHEDDRDNVPYEIEEMEVTSWIDLNNKKLLYGKLSSEFICCTIKTKNFEPYIKKVEEDGNGDLMNVIYYHRAAVVLWPVSNDIHMKSILNYTEEKTIPNRQNSKKKSSK